MPETQYVIKQLFFTDCQHWVTEQCPNLHSTEMQLSVINQEHLWLLNDKTVKALADMCKGCVEFGQI